MKTISFRIVMALALMAVVFACKDPVKDTPPVNGAGDFLYTEDVTGITI